MSAKILVTGDTGVIGSILVLALLADGSADTALGSFRYNQTSCREAEGLFPETEGER